MASSGSGYDLSSSTFSPDGRIFQVEYATKAVENSGTSLGLQCSDGIVLAVEKTLMNKMLCPGTSRRIHSVDSHAGIALCGFVSDGRQIANRARDEALSYSDNYGTKIPPAVLAERIASYIHYFTLTGSLRPFGCSALLAAHDSDTKKTELFMIDPSGTSYQYFGCAAGKGRQPARTELEKLSLAKSSALSDVATEEPVTCREGVKKLAKIIHLLHDEGKDKPFELEMSWVCEESKFVHAGVPKDIIKESVEWAKKDIEEMEEGDDDEEEDMEE